MRQEEVLVKVFGRVGRKGSLQEFSTFLLFLGDGGHKCHGRSYFGRLLVHDTVIVGIVVVVVIAQEFLYVGKVLGRAAAATGLLLLMLLLALVWSSTDG